MNLLLSSVPYRRETHSEESELRQADTFRSRVRKAMAVRLSHAGIPGKFHMFGIFCGSRQSST